MLTALASALIDVIRVLVESLVDIALSLEGSPLGVAWLIFLAIVLQLLVFILSIFVWWSRGTLWPIACAVGHQVNSVVPASAGVRSAQCATAA